MGQTIKEQAMANEAVILIKEIIEEAVFLRDNFWVNVTSSENGKALVLKDKKNNLLEYSLSEVSSIFCDEINGLWEIEGNIFDYLESVKEKNNEKYNTLSREEFINYIGKLYYLQYRCEEVYSRLKEIENNL